jgi:hypothetical protein
LANILPLPTLEFWIVTHPEDLIYNCPCHCFSGEIGCLSFQREMSHPNFIYSTTSVMKKVQLVYAEVMNGITEAMRNDPLVAIISDTGVFIVTTEENSQKYDEEFYPVSTEAIEAYYDDLKIFFRLEN